MQQILEIHKSDTSSELANLFANDMPYLNNEDITRIFRDGAMAGLGITYLELLNCEYITGRNCFSNHELCSIILPKVKILSASCFEINYYSTTPVDIFIAPLVEQIGERCFYHMNIKKMRFYYLKEIPDEAFYGARITQFIGDNVTSIDRNSFDYCMSLQRVMLPKITAINDEAFFDCIDLETVVIGTDNGGTIPSLGNKAFYETGPMGAGAIPLEDVKFYVPDELVLNYKEDYDWRKYTSKIFGISELPEKEREALFQDRTNLPPEIEEALYG